MARDSAPMTFGARRAVGLVAGSVTAVAMASVAVFLVRRLWPAYAAAEPTKHYSLAMLVARLSAGALCAAGASVVATRIARDSAAIGWWLGAMFLAVSLPHHVWVVWADYPWWYHMVYLSYLVPVAGLVGGAVSFVRRGDAQPGRVRL